jgi:hypothetical protein
MSLANQFEPTRRISGWSRQAAETLGCDRCSPAAAGRLGNSTGLYFATPPLLPVSPTVTVPIPYPNAYPQMPTVSAMPVGASWFDQQMISGIPNLWLLAGAAALFFFVGGSGRKRSSRPKRRAIAWETVRGES